MIIKRTLPPAAAPISFSNIINGIFCWLKGRSEIDRLISEIKIHFNIKHCFLLSSGKAALAVTLMALHEIRPERDEVLIPAYTCYSVASAIVRAGLKIKLCDIDPETLDFNYKELDSIVNKQSDKRLLAVIPTHLFGIPADVGRLRPIIKDPRISIVEDAAQAMGGEWNGKKLGTMGSIGFFSLGRGKAISTIEGGIILTNDDEIAEKISNKTCLLPKYGLFGQIGLLLQAILLSMFIRPYLYWFPKSLPFLKLGDTVYEPAFAIKKMSRIQASIAIGWQKKIKKLSDVRVKNSKYWVQYCNDKKINLNPKIQNMKIPSLLRFPVKVKDEKMVAKILKKSEALGLGIMPSYPDSICCINELKGQFKKMKFPIARDCARKIVTLPVHSFVSEKDRVRIIGAFNSVISDIKKVAIEDGLPNLEDT